MKIPSPEFWFKVGACLAASGELKNAVDQNIFSKNIFEEQKDRAAFLVQTLNEIAAEAYTKEEENK
jgi:hypothetical protein